MKPILATIAVAALLSACEESQSSIDIRKERALTGKEKEAREQYYRDEAAAHAQAKREGSSSSMSGLGNR